MKLAPTDTEHPDVLIEAKKIEAAGGFDFVEAFGELTAVLDSLFDGHGDRGYIGASKTADQVFFEHRPHGAFRIFSRQFWGYNASVIAVLYLKGHRPVLMSIVAVDQGVPNAGYQEPLTYESALARALQLARERCKDI